ncbi:tyrosine-type recombinase/integrase [Bradyrhizobium sp. USDA 4508]
MAKIRLQHVNRIRNKNRADKSYRYYFRVRGQKAIPLPGKPGSDEFMTAYGLALAGLEKARQGETAIAVAAAKLAKPGTIAALVPSYYRSAEWLNLASDTKEARERIIRKFVHGDAKKGLRGYGTFPVAMFTEQNLVDIRDKIASLSARRSWLKAIKHLFQHAVPSLIAKNPAEKIDQVRLPKTKGHHSWFDSQIAQYRTFWKLGTKQRLVLEFALETVSRRGEVVWFGPQHCYVGEQGERRIRIERTHGSDDVDIPMSDELAAAIDAMPIPTAIDGVVPLTYLHTERGKMRSKKALGNDFAGWVKAAGLPDECRMHGLKKGGMRRGAEAGLTTHELMGRSGHKSLAEVQRYTDAANKRKLADSGAEKLKAAAAKGPKLITKRSAS